MSKNEANVVSCDGCGSPIGRDTYEPAALQCLAGHAFEASFPLAVATRSTSIGLRALLARGHWQRAWTERAAGGPVIAAACPRCSAPAVLPPDMPLHCPCTSCGRGHTARVDEALLDLLPSVFLPKPDWELRGGLTFEPFVVQASSHEDLGCPSCGAPVEPFEGEGRCRSCDARLVVLLAAGQRFVPGMRVTGHHRGADVNGWMPVTEALQYLEGYRELGWASLWATASGFGVVFLVMGASFVLMPLVFGAVACMGPLVSGEVSLAMALLGFGGIAALMLVGGIAMFVVPVLMHRRARRRLGVEHAPDVQRY